MNKEITKKEFESMTPYKRGYAVYMFGANDEQPNVPDEKNPYPNFTSETNAWEHGNSTAMFDTIEGGA